MENKSQQKKSPFQFKTLLINLAGGGSAGFTEICIMHPLDVVKTRFQIQTSKIPGDSNYYNSVFDCMRKITKQEGFWSLYKGVIPPILVETPKRGLKFMNFEIFKEMLGSLTPTTYFIAGLGSGVAEGILVNPFEVIKVAQQANRSKHDVAPSTFQVARKIINTEGFGSRGLNKGLTATIGRNGVFNMIYFGFFHSVSGKIKKPQEPWLQNLQKFVIGFISGIIGSVVNIPFDVAKSRIQGPQPVLGQIKYRTTMTSISLVYKEEGLRALYKGLVPKVLRLGPGAGIMMLVFENVSGYLRTKFPDE